MPRRRWRTLTPRWRPLRALCWASSPSRSTPSRWGLAELRGGGPPGRALCEARWAAPCKLGLRKEGAGATATDGSRCSLPRRPLPRLQVKAVVRLLAGKSVVVCAPTGAGKTAIAEAATLHYLGRGQRVIYTTPLKALSNQKLGEMRERFGCAEAAGARVGRGHMQLMACCGCAGAGQACWALGRGVARASRGPGM